MYFPVLVPTAPICEKHALKYNGLIVQQEIIILEKGVKSHR